jgi:hypothetical protein
VGFVSLVFDLAGATLIREGNVLVLPTGRVGVAEACSGIRSLTGCLFSGALLGAAFFRSFAVVVQTGLVAPKLGGKTTRKSLQQSLPEHLLGLAIHHGGRFATFDRRIDPSAIPGGPAVLIRIA